ncbi:hypothetical protein BH11ACT8_BH11ACT8_23960 [soil metagenome]
MLHRRSAAVAAGVLLLAAPVLSSCGFDAATNRVNTISTGVNDRDGEVDVLGAAIIAGADNVGLLVGSLANNSLDTADTLTTVGGSVATVDPAFAGLDVPAANAVSLFDQGGIAVDGAFVAGDFVSVTLGFSSGQSTTIKVNVVKPCYQYDPAKFDPPLVLPTAADVAGDPAASEGATAEASAAAGEPGAYSCDIETKDASGGAE